MGCFSINTARPTYVQSKPAHKRSDLFFNNICIRIIRWFPVFFVLLILIWSYFAYIIQFCFYTLKTKHPNSLYIPSKIGNNTYILYIIVFHGLFISMLWAYLMVTFNGKWKIRKKFHENFDIPPIYFATIDDVSKLESSTSENQIANVLHDISNRINFTYTDSQIQPLKMCTLEGGPRFCDICKLIKPDRSHHCAACGKCILKMDHHCPWVNNCVQYGNYKQFILFLFYGLCLCLFAGATTLPYFLSFWSSTTAPPPPPSSAQLSSSAVLDAVEINEHNPVAPDDFNNPASSSHYSTIGDSMMPDSVLRAVFTPRFNVLFLFFVALMFGISLAALLIYHCYLVGKNRTTLESFRVPLFYARNCMYEQQIQEYRAGIRTQEPAEMIAVSMKDAFNLKTFCRNFRQVFGKNVWTWPLPTNRSEPVVGNGILYPTLSEYERSCCNAASQQTAITYPIVKSFTNHYNNINNSSLNNQTNGFIDGNKYQYTTFTKESSSSRLNSDPKNSFVIEMGEKLVQEN